MHEFSTQNCDFDQLDDVTWENDLLAIIKSTLNRFIWVVEQLEPDVQNISSELKKQFSHILTEFINKNSAFYGNKNRAELLEERYQSIIIQNTNLATIRNAIQRRCIYETILIFLCRV